MNLPAIHPRKYRILPPSGVRMTLEDELLGSSRLFRMMLEDELDRVTATSEELSGVTMLESCGTSAGPVLFESEEHEVRMVLATAAVINEIPSFLNIQRI